jgi:lipopolysaccharide/colanic/teichoic acid biosynthesis glycosyltransferase
LSVESSLPCVMEESEAREPPSRRGAAGLCALARRVFNVGVAVFGLIVLAIPFVVIVMAIKATSPGPVLFRQLRVGRGGQLFQIYKFRTMVEDGVSHVPAIGIGMPASVTRLGRFLRETKIDELPQLINVLIGNMNLVGPRPELPEFVAEYPARDRSIVLSVEPGLTDFASIRFRNEGLLLGGQEDALDYYHRIVMPAKLRYCRFYVRRASLGLDLYLIGLTILAVGKDFLFWFARPAVRPAPAATVRTRRRNTSARRSRRAAIE